MSPAAPGAAGPVTARAVDVAQVRWIVQASLRQELRSTRGLSGVRRRPGGLISTFLTVGFSGLLSGFVFTGRADPFAGALLSSSVLMLLVATFVVVEFATIGTGPDDLAFYAHLPVAPRTYVAAKLGVIAVFALAASAVFAVPAVALAAASGVGVGAAAALAWSLLAGAAASAFAVAALLGLAVRFVPFHRIRTAAWYLQFAIFIGLYGGFAIVQRSLQDSMVGFAVELSWPLVAAPSAWGASLLAVGPGEPATGPAVAGICLSVLGPAVLAAAAWRVLSASYAGRIPEATLAPRSAAGTRGRAGSRAKRPAARGLPWRTPEERAVALLIGRQFRFDQQFRFTIMAIVPITIIYLGIILLANRAPVLDPFTPAGRSAFPATILLYVAIGFFPMYLKGGLVTSTQADASWILHVSPADRLLLLRATRRFIAWYFLAPYLLLLGALFALLTHAVLDTLRHFAAVGALVMIETDVLLLFFPELPFSRRQQIGQRNAALIVRMVAGLLILPPLYLLVTFCYPRPPLAWAGLAGLGVLLAVVRVAGSRFAARRLERQEMPG